MPLTLAELEAVQQDALADDVAIDFERMKVWSLEEAEKYFESGGTEAPAVDVSESPAPAPTPLGRKVRIGLLHGTANNATIMRMQLGKLLGKLRPTCELNIIEGPLAPDESEGPAAAQVKVLPLELLHLARLVGI